MVTIWADPGIVSLEAEGYPLSKTIYADPGIVSLSAGGGQVPGVVVDADPGIVILTPKANTYTYSDRRNFVAWSKPGDVRVFTELVHGIDRTNSSGQAPMEWPSWATNALQLEDLIIIYGQRGISVMKPYMDPIPTFGFELLSELGLKGFRSVAGNSQVHYFIARTGDLWRLTKKGPELLGFREYMNQLISPILAYDENEDRLYLSDGVTGFCFDEGLGGGYATLTSASDGLFGSPESLLSIPINIMSDTFDLGHRGIKYISFVEVGTDTTEDMYIALDFRYNKGEVWRTSAWTLLNNEGVARPNIAGVEFRLRLKQNTYDDISIDYVNVRFQKHDRRFLRGPLFAQENEETSQ